MSQSSQDPTRQSWQASIHRSSKTFDPHTKLSTKKLCSRYVFNFVRSFRSFLNIRHSRSSSFFVSAGTPWFNFWIYGPLILFLGNAILPQTFRERQVSLQGQNSNPSRMEDTLQLWYDTQIWKMAPCTSQNAKSDLNRVKDKLNRIMLEVFQRNNVF